AEFRAVDKFSHVVKKMTMGVKNFSGQSISAIQRMDRKFTKSIGRMKSMVGGFGLFVGGAALVGALGGAIKITADYEQSTANLAAILGVNIEETKKLQENSKRLGATTSFTAAEVAGLQTEYAKLGFPEQEILM